MADASRAAYRQRLSVLARQRGIPEHLAAKRVLTLAEGARGQQRHVGWWLYRAPLGQPERVRSGGAYIVANTLLTLILSLLSGFYPAARRSFFFCWSPCPNLSGRCLISFCSVAPGLRTSRGSH